jgi:hypothetical protein
MKRCYEFGPDQVAAIDRLSVELGIDKTDVLHNGLRLLRQAVREARRGNELGIVNGERVVGRLCGIWDDAGVLA